jgi:hypothetical protein
VPSTRTILKNVADVMAVSNAVADAVVTHKKLVNALIRAVKLTELVEPHKT